MFERHFVARDSVGFVGLEHDDDLLQWMIRGTQQTTDEATELPFRTQAIPQVTDVVNAALEMGAKLAQTCGPTDSVYGNAFRVVAPRAHA